MGATAAAENSAPGATAPESAVCAPALSVHGGAGHYDLPLAEAGCPWQLRLGGAVNGFSQSGYLFTDDTANQISGSLQAAANLGSHLELSLQLLMQQSRTNRPAQSVGESALTAPPQGFGSTLLAAKLHADWGPLLHAALRPLLRVHSGPADIGPNFRSIDFGVDVLGTLDLGRRLKKLPLRLHWALGYLHDRSGQLIADQDCMASGATRCLAERLILTSALSIGQPRLRTAMGADFAVLRHRRALLQALAIYHLDIGVTGGDAVLRALLMDQPPGAAIDDRLSQWLTLGARLHLAVPMNIELGVRVGLASAGYAMGAKLPAVSGYGALSWQLDLLNGPSSGKPSEKPSVEPAATSTLSLLEGVVRGMVRDAQSGAPLPDAVVRLVGARHNALLTDERGEFRTAGLPAGAVLVEASRGDHQTRRAVVLLRGGEVAPVELALPPVERSTPARLLVEVRDDSGAPAQVTGTLAREGQSPVELTLQAGTLTARVQPGTWTLRVTGPGLLAREQLVVLVDGGELRMALRLTRRPAVPRAQLGADEILLSEPLQFVPQTVTLSTESGRVLDEVIDLLVRHPELKQLRIEHGGEGGAMPTEPGLALWEQQAIAIRDFLVQRGVAPERIVADVVARPGRPAGWPPGSPGRRGPRITFKIAAQAPPSSPP